MEKDPKVELAAFGGQSFSKVPIAPRPSIDEDEIQAVTEVLRSGKLSSLAGQVTAQFEREFANYLGAKYAVATSNGTAALHTALATLSVNPGDEVIVPAFTFVATASCVLHQDAIPVFADIDPDTFNTDPADVRRKITDRTKAIIVVHLFGHPANMDEISEIAKEHGVYVLEDCAQSIGALYNNRKVGTIGDIAAFSFYATKNMTTGEGGMVVTNRGGLDEEARMVRNHGEVKRYNYVRLGYNYRMTEVQAAIGCAQLRKLDHFNSIRRRNAEIYSEELRDLDALTLPSEGTNVKHTWYLYSVGLNIEFLRTSRDEFVRLLRAENVPATVAYPSSLNTTTLFADLYNKGKRLPFYQNIRHSWGECPIAERTAERIFNLYTDPALSEDQIVTTAGAVRKVVRALV